eukprot:scaffold639_cov215-Prasinococcus_capsulatus_cf.AAC.1
MTHVAHIKAWPRRSDLGSMDKEWQARRILASAVILSPLGRSRERYVAPEQARAIPVFHLAQ